MLTNLEDIGANINFDDSIYSGKYISVPTKIGDVGKLFYNTTYNNTSNSSESDFTLARLSKQKKKI